MALSTFKNYWGPIWPLGFIGVANNGTPVNIMHTVDPSNNNAPWTPTTYGGVVAETSPACHKIFMQGLHPGSNNNGMIVNTGMVYVLRTAGGGSANRSDSGAMVAIIYPGGSTTFPAAESELNTLSPYDLLLDSDVDGEGCLVTLMR